MQTSNTEEMVTISRAEYEQLQQENAQLEAKSAKLEEAHTRLEAKLAAREQEQAQVITSLTLQNEWAAGAAEAVPADYGQLAAEGFGEVDAARSTMCCMSSFAGSRCCTRMRRPCRC